MTTSARTLRWSALVMTVACGPFGATAVRAQEPDWQAAAGGKMRFEAASVKRATTPRVLPSIFPLDQGDAKTPGGRFSASMPLVVFVQFAYKVPNSDIGQPLPKSLPMGSFEIEARAPGNPTKDQMRLMMQSLLADRFHLKVHFETREGPVLALTVVRPGNTGPKLHSHAEGPACPDTFELPAMGPGIPEPPRNANDVFPPTCGDIPSRGMANGTLIGGRDLTMEIIAGAIRNYGSLAREIDKPVIDQTGLKGRYDFTLQLPPGALHLMTVVASRSDGALPDVPETPFTNALRDQLGLKLVSTKGPIRKLVIDHVEPLSGN